jgi:UDP-N-acetylglucosamine transferase subunit ALG13
MTVGAMVPSARGSAAGFLKAPVFVPKQDEGEHDAHETAGVTPALRPMVVVSVGTDHHPFDRLVGWVDRWALAHSDVDVVVQYGSAQLPNHARGVGFLSHTELVANITAAAVVVCHGGPATIAEAWRAGMIPLVLPRNSGFGEHVDNHQMTFTGVLASRGQVIEISDETQLDESLTRALADPAWLHRESGHALDVSVSLRNIEDVVRSVTGKRRARHSLFHRVARESV